MTEMRYFRWRTAIKKPPIWAIDQGWYRLLGLFYLMEHFDIFQPPKELEHICTDTCDMSGHTAA